MGKNLDYDHRLKDRGTIHIDRYVLKSFEIDRNRMNKEKTRRRFLYSDEMIIVLAYIHLYFRLPYRQTQGLAESLFGKHITVPSYSTICKRINNLDFDLTAGKKTYGTIVIAIDSTRMKVTNRGDWMREKHSVTRKGFIKLHATINVNFGRVTGFVVTDESSHDSNHFTELVEQSQQCRDVC